MSDRELLLAYVAAEAASIAAALNVLADQGGASRAGALQAQEMADVTSWRWAQAVGIELQDPVDRMVAVQQFIAENVSQLEELRDRLSL